MSDLLDNADAATEFWLQTNLKNRSEVPKNTGYCLFCEEPTHGAFCSKDCRDLYEKVHRGKVINGQR